MKLLCKIALVVFILFLAGTMPSLEPSRRIVAEAVAIDFENGEYVISAYGVTDFDENGITGRLCVASGLTPREAVSNFAFTEGKDLFLKQCKLLLIGPEAAEHLEELLEFFAVTRELNYFTRVALTKDSAFQQLEFEENSGGVDDLYYLTEKQRKEEETYQNRMLDLLKQGMGTSKAYLLPVFSGGKVESVTAFYENRAMANFSTDEYRLAELLLGLSSTKKLILNGENAAISQCEMALKVNYDKGVLHTKQEVKFLFSGTEAQRVQLEERLRQVGETLVKAGALPIHLSFKMTDYTQWKALQDSGEKFQVSYDLQITEKAQAEPAME